MAAAAQCRRGWTWGWIGALEGRIHRWLLQLSTSVARLEWVLQNWEKVAEVIPAGFPIEFGCGKPTGKVTSGDHVTEWALGQTELQGLIVSTTHSLPS